MSIATSELKSSLQFRNSFSCILLCLVPTVSCSIIRSLDSALSINLDYKARLRHCVKKTSKRSSLFCNCNWYLAYLWVTLGQGVKLRLIQAPMRLNFSLWRPNPEN